MKNRLAAILTILILFVGLIPLSVKADGISGYVGGLWHLDEGMGTMVYDSSGNSNHGTVYGGAMWTDGKIGKALEFDGVDDYVEVPDSDSLDITGKITLEAWIYPYSMTHMQVIVAKYNHSAPYNGAYYVGIGGYGYLNKILFGLSYDGLHFYYMLSNTNITANTWTHVAATSNGTHMILYIHGIKDKVRAYAPSVIYASAAPLRIGCYLPELGFPRFFDGVIDEVKVSATTIWTVDDDRVQCPTADFTEIQDAIDAASPGDTIYVYDGTYNEALYINKMITIKAASKPIIKGSQLVTTNYYDVDAVIFVEDATNVVIEGFDIEGEGWTATRKHAIQWEDSTGTIRDCTVSANTIGDMSGLGIAFWDNSDLTIDSCTIQNYGRVGVYCRNSSTGGVYDSTIIGQVYSDEDKVNYGIEVEGLFGTCDIEIIGNEIYNCDNTYSPEPLWSSAGIMIDGFMEIPPEYLPLGGPMYSSTVIIERNDIYDNYYGIEVVANPYSYAHYNNIYNNREYGVVQDSDYAGNNATFNARFNWWGHKSGPYHDDTNLMGLGNKVTDNVTYSPWLGFVVGTTPMTYHVNPTGKIQDAIDDASPGDTILVHNGTYNEALYINKTLTIKAASTPIIKGAQSVTTNYGARDVVIFVEDATDVVIEGFDIEGEGLGLATKDYGVIFEESSGTIKDCTVSPNTIGDMNSAAIGAWDESSLTVDSCTVKNFGRIGIFYFGGGDGGSGGAVYNSIIEGQVYSDPDYVNYGIEIEAYNYPCDIEIIGNEIYNCSNTHSSPSWSSAGIVIDGWLGLFSTPSSTVDVSHNNIYDNYYGIEVVANPYSYAHYNNIYNNREYGVVQDSDYAGNNATFNARFNWWGHASGPYHNVTNTGGLGDKITDYVHYSPWFGFITGTSPMTYHVNPTGKIQDAIDDASSGDTIKVYEGTYTEQLVINKTLTLQGDPGPKIVAPDTRNTYTIAENTATWDPIIFVYGGTESGGAVSGSGTISVTIDGFEIDGGNKAVAAPTRFVGILYRNVNPGVISNNNIHDMYDADGEGDGPQTFGIMAYGDSDVTIESNEVRDFSRGGIGVSGDAGVLPDPIATVKLNTVLGNGLETGNGWWAENGIQIAWGAGGSIIENDVADCQVNSPSWVATGIMVYDAEDGVNVLDNSVADCDTGIAVISPSHDLVDGNVVTGCAWDGIRLGWPVNNCTVSNNIISNNWAGIGIWDASDNTIENNIIENNEYGIYMDGDSHNNAILDNDILNNMIDGIHIEPYGGFDPSGTEVHCNNIVGNGICGVNKTGVERVDATWNWWGNNTGPYHPTTNPSGTGDRVSDNVDYEPWKMRPTLKVDPPSTTIGLINKTFTINITINNLQAEWKAVGFEFRLTYNATLLEVMNVTEGPFLAGFPQRPPPYSTLFLHYIEAYEYGPNVLVGTLLLPNDVGSFPGPFPSGDGTIATVTFKAIYQEKGYSKTKGYIKPPLTCNLTLLETMIVDANNNKILHYTEDGSYRIEPLNIGDVNWDGKVRVDDVLKATQAFGTESGHPRWNPEADLNGDSKIRVDDILAIALEFGWTSIDC